jgi:catechol 2,3-dioxygenase-like lactoylglutathione lyase family enzyme
MAIVSFEINSVPVSDQERAKIFYRDTSRRELVFGRRNIRRWRDGVLALLCLHLGDFVPNGIEHAERKREAGSEYPAEIPHQ